LRVDETYIKVKGKWTYLYRAVDQHGQTIDFWLSRSRNRKAAKKLFRKAMRSVHNSNPRVITTDKTLPLLQQLRMKSKKRDSIPKQNTGHRSI